MDKTKADLSLLPKLLERIFKNPLGAYYFETNFGKEDDVKSTVLGKFEFLQLLGWKRETGRIY